jgi:hypothetical protein
MILHVPVERDSSLYAKFKGKSDFTSFSRQDHLATYVSSI